MDNNFLEMAKAIVAEINDAWAFPEQNAELSKVGTMGYMAEVGCPHQWWEANCKAYARASENLARGRDLNNVCRLAQAMLSEND